MKLTSLFLAKKVKIIILITNDGIVVHSNVFALLYKSDPEIADAKLKPSDIGDCVSPKKAPQQIAPTITGAGIPIDVAIP